LRRFPRHRDVLRDHLLNSGAQVFVRVRHAQLNRTLNIDRSTPPLNGYPGVGVESARAVHTVS
jgi:hypothetical protein